MNASVGLLPHIGDRVRVDPHAAILDKPITIQVTAVEKSSQDRWIRLSGTALDADGHPLTGPNGDTVTVERLFVRVDLLVVLHLPAEAS